MSESGFAPAVPRLRLALRDRARSSPFFRKVSVMLAGAAIGQAASVLLSPVLTRLYNPQQIGTLSVFIAIVTVLSGVGALRYEMTLPIAASEADAANLSALGGAAVALTTILVGIASFLVPSRWLAACWLEPLAPWRVLFPLAFALLAGFQLVMYMATRDSAFRAIARTRIAQGFAAPAMQIALGLLGAGSPGLVLGFVAGQWAGTFGLLRRVLLDHRGMGRLVSVGRMRVLARRYWRFPVIASWAALIDTAGANQMLYVLASITYSARVAGFVFLAERVVARPLVILGTSFLQVFVGEAGRAALDDPRLLRRRFWQVSARQGAVALTWVVLANLGAAMLLPELFGVAWGGAVGFIRALSVAYLAQALVQPVFHTLQILERQVLAACWQVARLALVVAGFLLSARFGLDAEKATLVYAVVQAGCCLVLFGLMARAVERVQP